MKLRLNLRLSSTLTPMFLFFVVPILHASAHMMPSITGTYGLGDIPTNLTSYSGGCNGPLTTVTLSLPPGGPWTVTGIDIEYNMTAQGGGWKSHQRSRVHSQATNTTESTIYEGSGNTGGVQAYSRANVNIANGTYSGNTNLVFEMRAWRTSQGIGCNATFNRVDNFSWTVTVVYEALPPEGNVGIGTTTPAPSALLDLQSVQRGFLPPRMTTNLRTAIPSPAAGLMVYDTDLDSLFLRNGGNWTNLATGPATPWTISGSSIYRLTGNVGIGDATPAATFTVGNGDKFQVSGTDGTVTFTDDLASIRFPPSALPNNPMIYMFTSGTTNADRMVLGHSPAFPNWGMEYRDTADFITFRNTATRSFNFNLASGRLGIGMDNPQHRIDLQGQIRLMHDGGIRPGIWFRNQAGTFDRARFGMAEPDSVIGIWSQHLNRWAIEFEIMREPRIGINIPAGSPPRAEVHLYHTNFGGSNDGVRIQNEGANAHFWNLYTANSTGMFEFFKQGIKRATIDPASGAYTAVSDARLKTNINPLGDVLSNVMRLQPKTYQFLDFPEHGPHTGLIAQELEEVFPQYVYYGGDAQVTYTVDYSGLSVIAIKAIQEQQAQIDNLQEEVTALRALLEQLRTAIGE